MPSNPWIAGIGNLFTVEFFEACRARLTDDGVLCNWIHKINMREGDFRTVLRTFTEVFGDNAQLWDFGLDCMLIGSKAPVQLDGDRFRRMLENPEIARDLAALGVTDEATFLKHYRLDAAGLAAFVGDGDRNTDNFPVLEFSCPYGLYGHRLSAYGDLTTADRHEIDGSWLRGISSEIIARANVLQDAFLQLERVRSAEDRLRGAIAERRLAGKPLTDPGLFQLAIAITDELTRVEKSLRIGKDPWLDDRTNRLAQATLDVKGTKTLAATLSRYFLKVASGSPDAQTKRSYLERALPYARDDEHAPEEHAKQWLALGAPASAIPVLESDVLAHPSDPIRLRTLGVLYAAAGDPAKGLATLDRALAAAEDKPLRSEILQNRGYTLERAGQRAAAIEAYRQAIVENPENAGARGLLQKLQSS